MSEGILQKPLTIEMFNEGGGPIGFIFVKNIRAKQVPPALHCARVRGINFGCYTCRFHARYILFPTSWRNRRRHASTFVRLSPQIKGVESCSKIPNTYTSKPSGSRLQPHSAQPRGQQFELYDVVYIGRIKPYRDSSRLEERLG